MDYDLTHKKYLQQYIKQIEKAFEKLISEASTIVLRIKLTEELFKFKKNPKISKDINRVLQQYNDDLVNIINEGMEGEWQLANDKINHFQTLQLQRIAGKISKHILIEEIEKISRSPRNIEALKLFQERKVNDFTISDRVWQITKQMRDELEFAIDVSFAEGKSANALAREIKKYLNEPDRLYRRVRDKHGNLVLSQNAKNFHPGQGVYRSSHKNALRLAKEEINTAYRESEQLRIMQNNDIVGVEIHLSPSHKIYDICDELKGKYPKNFKWSKWHVGCMCYRSVIMKRDEEFIKELRNGENFSSESSKNYISDVPNNFKKWYEENKDRFKNWKYKPSFLEENKQYFDEKVKERYKEYKKLLRDKNYTDISFDRNKGGLKATHKLHSFDPNRGYYEKEVRDILFRNGHKVILAKEKADIGEIIKDGQKHIDGYLNNSSFDISTILGSGKNTIKKAFQHSYKKNAEIAILYFPKKEIFSEEKIYTGLKMFKGTNSKYKFKEIIIVVDEKIMKL